MAGGERRALTFMSATRTIRQHMTPVVDVGVLSLWKIDFTQFVALSAAGVIT